MNSISHFLSYTKGTLDKHPNPEKEKRTDRHRREDSVYLEQWLFEDLGRVRLRSGRERVCEKGV